jgi:hypothetical protein
VPTFARIEDRTQQAARLITMAIKRRSLRWWRRRFMEASWARAFRSNMQ